MVFSPSTTRKVNVAPHSVLVDHLLAQLRQVGALLGQEIPAANADTRFADVLDSMGFVEFLALAADECGVPVEAIEAAAARRYGTVGELAAALLAAGIAANPPRPQSSTALPESMRTDWPLAWLSAAAARLPEQRQPASILNELVGRPSGWLEKHAGIESRCLWAGQDPLQAAADCARDCLDQTGLSPAALGAVLATSETPPLLTGLAASLHARLGPPCGTPALEVGGACTGFLAALWTATHLLAGGGAVLVIAVEAPSRWLSLQPDRAGENAALFGDAAAACLLTAQPLTGRSLRLRALDLGSDGTAGSLLRIEYEASRGVRLHMDGIALAHRAVRAMADAVRQICTRHDLRMDQLAAVVAHGGNGRMAASLARRLGLPLDRTWSETTHTGNLGSASLPVAWTCGKAAVAQPVVWTAVGAGLQWGAALFDAPA